MHAIKEKDSASKKVKGKKIEEKNVVSKPVTSKKISEVKVELPSANKTKPKVNTNKVTKPRNNP